MALRGRDGPPAACPAPACARLRTSPRAPAPARTSSPQAGPDQDTAIEGVNQQQHETRTRAQTGKGGHNRGERPQECGGRLKSFPLSNHSFRSQLSLTAAAGAVLAGGAGLGALAAGSAHFAVLGFGVHVKDGDVVWVVHGLSSRGPAAGIGGSAIKLISS